MSTEKTCRFCNPIRMKEAIVYSDASIYAIVSSRPLSYGHILVIPRRHVERLEDLESDETAALFDAVRYLLPKLLNATDAHDYNLFINAGQRANQNILHLHVHLVPRRAQANHLDVFFAAFANERTRRLPRNLLKRMASSIRKGLN